MSTYISLLNINVCNIFGLLKMDIEVKITYFINILISFQVSYISGVKADQGNELTPTQVKDQPKLKWNADPSAFYTVCMTGSIFIKEK